MEHGSLGVLAYLGAWFTTIGGVWFLFEKADETLAPEVRDRLGAWLEGVTAGDGVRQWPEHFITLFDRVFGRKHLSSACFKRSAVATFMTTWIIGGCWIGLHPPESFGTAALALLLVTMAGLLLSLIPDYLSLLETRFVLGRLSRGGSALAWLALDAVATVLLAGSMWVVLIGLNEGVHRMLPALQQLAMFQATISVGNTMTETGEIASSLYEMPMAPFFYATFFTSAWLWMFAGASLMVRVVTSVLDKAARLRGLVDVRRKPGRSLGLAAVILVTLGYAGVLPVALLLRSLG